MAFIKILNAATANGNSSQYYWDVGEGQVVVSGTFDGATVKLQLSPDDGTTWVDVGTASTFTAAGGAGFTVNACKLRINISAVGASSEISAWISSEVDGDISL
mgnify:CR=1 FL=1